MFPFPQAAAGAAPLAPVTFNPADKNANASLSNNNLSIVNGVSQSGFAGARSTTGQKIGTGKYYFEAVIQSGIANEIGIVTKGFAALNDAYGDTKSYFYYGGGNAYQGSINRGSIPQLGSGSVVGVAWDTGSGTIIIYKDGSQVFLDNSYYPGEEMFIYFAAYNANGDVGSGTIRTKQSSLSNLPVGYLPWDPS